MPAPSFEAFMNSHSVSDKADELTHTRIGDRSLNIYGGRYYIPAEDIDEFYRLYYNHVFVSGKQEYLVEGQLPEGPILVDLDFRYAKDVVTRQHTNDHIEDIITLYLSCLTKLLEVGVEEIPVFVLEKPNINTDLDDVTKDGIHLIFGVCADRTVQRMLREDVLREINDIIGDLGLTNSAKDVIDECITTGRNKWQMYGSRKPANEAYTITKYKMARYDAEEETFEFRDVKVPNDYTIMHLISARNSHHAKFPLREAVKTRYNNMSTKTTAKPALAIKEDTLVTGGHNVNWAHIRTEDELDACVNMVLKSSQQNAEDFVIIETHKFVMALPNNYSDNYPEWISTGWALHNTSFKLFPTWLKFSAKSHKFDYSDIPRYFNMWCEMKDEGLTQRSIMYWCKRDNCAEYEKICEESISHFMNETLRSNQEWDIANVLFQLCKDKFICVNVKNNVWYEFRDHRWIESDCATNLRNHISVKLHKLYANKHRDLLKTFQTVENGSKEHEMLTKNMATVSQILERLKKTSHKNNIMTEAREIFYDRKGDFIQRLNSNPYIIGFNNGIYDFKEREFREGRPEDYVSLSTNINYVRYDCNNSEHVRIKGEIEEFFHQIFPVQQLYDYMWDHLASTFIGKTTNQTFTIYNGVGRNGKSKLTELMSRVLGQYKGTVPSTLVTQKRTAIGSASPEIAQLQGIRYAVMQELSKGDRLNEGILKELTGGDPLQGRALYRDTVTFLPQFKLVVCTNNLPDTNSNDEGTWRRIRVCEFMSRFVEDPKPSAEEPYQFVVDKEIDRKFMSWCPILAALLIERAQETMGDVKDCEVVLHKSNEYRKKEDYMLDFVEQKVRKQKDSLVSQQQMIDVFRIWYNENYGGRLPKPREVYDFIDKKFGKMRNGHWRDIAIIVNNISDMNNDIEEDE